MSTHMTFAALLKSLNTNSAELFDRQDELLAAARLADHSDLHQILCKRSLNVTTSCLGFRVASIWFATWGEAEEEAEDGKAEFAALALNLALNRLEQNQEEEEAVLMVLDLVEAVMRWYGGKTGGKGEGGLSLACDRLLALKSAGGGMMMASSLQRMRLLVEHAGSSALRNASPVVDAFFAVFGDHNNGGPLVCVALCEWLLRLEEQNRGDGGVLRTEHRAQVLLVAYAHQECRPALHRLMDEHWKKSSLLPPPRLLLADVASRAAAHAAAYGELATRLVIAYGGEQQDDDVLQWLVFDCPNNDLGTVSLLQRLLHAVGQHWPTTNGLQAWLARALLLVDDGGSLDPERAGWLCWMLSRGGGNKDEARRVLASFTPRCAYERAALEHATARLG